MEYKCVCFRSDQSLSRVRLFATPWTAARQASLSITNSRSSLRLTAIKSVMPSSHLILCRPLLLLPPIPPSIRVFSNESTLDYICSKCIFVSSFSSFWLLSLSLLSGSCFLIQPSEAKSPVWWQVRCLLEPWSRVWSLEWAKRFQSFLFSTLTSLHPCWDLTDLKQRFLF